MVEKIVSKRFAQDKNIMISIVYKKREHPLTHFGCNSLGGSRKRPAKILK